MNEGRKLNTLSSEGEFSPEQIVPVAPIVTGKDLTPDDLAAINTHRKIEFGSSIPIVLDPEDENWNKLYFLVHREKELLAFGRLHDVEVECNGDHYQVLGIATVVAIQKSKGYGKLVMEEMKKYIQASNKTAIGFCNPDKSDFYRRCGLSVIPDGKSRVLHFEGAKPIKILESRAHGDLIYLDGKDGLMQLLNAKPDLKLTAFRAPW